MLKECSKLIAKQKNVNKNEPSYEWVELDRIKVDMSYQRKLNDLKVKKIINNFDMNAFGALLINKRDDDDDFYLIDGQHRSSAAKQKCLGIVPTIKLYGLTQQEEADLFVELNSNRYQIKSIDKFKAKVTSDNKNALEIVNIMNQYGFKPNHLNNGNISTRKRGYVTNVSSLEKIYNSKGLNYLEAVLRIISSTWRNKDGTFDPDALRRDTIEGIYTFLVKGYNKSNFDEKRLIKVLSKCPAGDVINKQNRNFTIFGKNKSNNYARAVLELYNTNTKFKLSMQF
jgi:hypothetical protein